MEKEALKVIETMTLENGLEIDLDEGWRKLIQRQFGGNPARAFGELIQNFIDSYASSVPWTERRAEIESGPSWVSITDYGEGMDLGRVRLLLTLGGTDKAGNPDKLGTFGIGFFSIFNPRLGTRTVRVTTRCEGDAVEVVFQVKAPEKRPLISSKVLDVTPAFSTRIEVEFTNGQSAEACLRQAELSLKFYPCRVTINGSPFCSIWESAAASGAHIFKDSGCHGFVEKRFGRNSVRVLCKYERIMEISLGNLIVGAKPAFGDLRDYELKNIPFLPGTAMTINSNDLHLVISRDSFYVDAGHDRMVQVIGRVLTGLLNTRLRAEPNPQLTIANQYIFQDRIQWHLREKPTQGSKTPGRPVDDLLNQLTTEKVYHLMDRKPLYSLKDIWDMREEGAPVFFSPRRLNLHWAGGSFKHRFVILPPECSLYGGAPDLYEGIFDSIFGDAVDLDTIDGNPERIKDLVERGIVDKEAISPRCEIVGERQLTSDEKAFLLEISEILNMDTVRCVIENHLHLSASRIEPVFFDVEEKRATIATGLFDGQGKALEAFSASNFSRENGESTLWESDGILLGLRRDHPLFKRLVASTDKERAYYTLAFLAHELVNCQKLLVAHSPFYHVIKERLAADMRKAVMMPLLSGVESDRDETMDASIH